MPGAPAAGFPQSGSNRTRNQAIAELLDYVGGAGDADEEGRAGRSWDAAVREMNMYAWKFNRVRQIITFNTVTPTADYNLNTDFRSPVRAMLQDSDSRTVTDLVWTEYRDWTQIYTNQRGSANMPFRYTARNAHETGIITFDPRPDGGTAGEFTYPTCQLDYHRRIAMQPTGDQVLDAPVEVDEAIFQLALAMHVTKVRGVTDGAPLRVLAERTRDEVALTQRDFPDRSRHGH